jgi:hypothetical protein
MEQRDKRNSRQIPHNTTLERVISMTIDKSPA